MADEVADVLERAADLLWVKGRCRGRDTGPEGEYCVERAVEVAAGADNENACADVYELAHSSILALRKHIGEVSHRWNDSTTDDELVIDTLRRCAKDLRNG